MNRLPATDAEALDGNWRLLKGCAIAYVVADGLHVLDHMRQGRHLAAQVYAAGTLGIIAALIVLTLVLRHHPVAPLAAAAFGTLDAVAVLLVHFPPNWFFLSDSYQPLHLDAVSWVSAAVVVAAAASLAVAGIDLMRTPIPQEVS